MKAVLCSVLLSTAGAAVSSDEVKEAPTDYATGVALETTGHSPWYRISLPQVVYQSTAWPDLRDVRVFNHLGIWCRLRWWRRKPRPLRQRQWLCVFSRLICRRFRRVMRVNVVGMLLFTFKNGIEIHLQSDDVTALGQSYLLTLPEERKDSLSLTQLRLNWGRRRATGRESLGLCQP